MTVEAVPGTAVAGGFGGGADGAVVEFPDFF